MLLIIPSLIVGGIVGGGQAYAASKANKRGVKAAKELQRRQFAHNIRMRETKIQVLAEDLEKAGFNRIIASGVGGAPSGATTAPASFPNLRNVGGEGTSGGVAAMSAGMTLRERAATIGQIQQSTLTSKEQGDLYRAQKTGVMADNAKRLLIGDSISSARAAASRVWNQFIPKNMLDQAGELMTTPDKTTAPPTIRRAPPPPPRKKPKSGSSMKQIGEGP